MATVGSPGTAFVGPPRSPRRRARWIVLGVVAALALLAGSASLVWHRYEHHETDRIAALLDTMPLPARARLDAQHSNAAGDGPAAVRRYYTIPGPRAPTSLQDTQFLAYVRQLQRAGYRPVDRAGRDDPGGFTLDLADRQNAPDTYTLPAGRRAEAGIEIQWLLPGSFVLSADSGVLHSR